MRIKKEVLLLMCVNYIIFYMWTKCPSSLSLARQSTACTHLATAGSVSADRIPWLLGAWASWSALAVGKTRSLSPWGSNQCWMYQFYHFQSKYFWIFCINNFHLERSTLFILSRYDNFLKIYIVEQFLIYCLKKSCHKLIDASFPVSWFNIFFLIMRFTLISLASLSQIKAVHIFPILKLYF